MATKTSSETRFMILATQQLRFVAVSMESFTETQRREQNTDNVTAVGVGVVVKTEERSENTTCSEKNVR